MLGKLHVHIQRNINKITNFEIHFQSALRLSLGPNQFTLNKDNQCALSLGQRQRKTKKIKDHGLNLIYLLC